ALHERRDRMEAYPDALPTIQAVKAMRLKTCAFTSLPAFMTAPGIKSLHPYLDHYLDAASAGFSKGDPRYYTAVAAKIAAAPDEIACVGDEPLSDCELPAE